MNDLMDIINFVNQHWLIILPFGIALMFLPKYTTSLIFIIFGFVVGAFGVFPALLNLQSNGDSILNFLKQNPTISMVIIGIIIAGIFAILLKFAMFVAAALIGFFAGKYLVEFLLRFFPNLNLNFKVLGLDVVYLTAIVIGLIVGVYSLINFDKILKYLSIAIGSFLTTLVIFTLLSMINLIPGYPQNIESWTLTVMIVLFMILFFLGAVVTRPKEKKSE